MIARRSFLRGFIGLVAAPAVVKFASIMPVKAMPPADTLERIGQIVFRGELVGEDIYRRVADELRHLAQIRRRQIQDWRTWTPTLRPEPQFDARFYAIADEAERLAAPYGKAA